MSRHDFPEAEFLARRARLFAAMAARGLRYYLVFQPTSMHWLAGFEAKSYQSFQCLIADAATGQLIMFARDGEQAELADDLLADRLCGWAAQKGEDPLVAFVKLAGDLGLGRGEGVAMEVPAFYLHPHHYLRLKEALPQIVEANDLVHDLRLVKSPAELVYIREAARVADASLSALREALREGVSELELAAAVYHRILTEGGEAPPVPLNLVSGPRAAQSHGAPGPRRLQRGDSGNAEYCVPLRRHCVSIGRSFVLGEPPARLLAMHEAVAASGRAIMAAIRPGVPVHQAYSAGYNVLKDAGFADLIAHTIGYSVSSAFPPATGERFGLTASGQAVFAEGMTLSVAPNLFDAEARLGARVVSNIVVTQSGAEWLSGCPDTLISVA